MNILKYWAIALAITCTWSLTTTSAFAGVVATSLSFSSQNQSMWGPGAASQFSYNQFIGTTWHNKSVSVGGFVGGTTKLYNPSWLTWHLCLINCGPEPSKYVYVSTKTGAQASATSSGKVGFNVGFTMDSGSLNSSADYTTQVNLPTAVSAGQLINLNTSGGSAMTNGGLDSHFPSLSASLSAVVQASANFSAAACFTGACASTTYSTGTLGGTQDLVSFNNGNVTWFGGGGTLYNIVNTAANLSGHPLPTGLPASFDIPAGGTSTLGTVTIDYPHPDVTGTLNPAGTMITGSATSSTAISFSANVSNLISLATTGVSGLFDGSVDMGAGFGVNYNVVGVNAGPTISLTQNFDLTPTLKVNLAFSNPVNVTGYGLVNQVNGLSWDNLPSMAFGIGDTTITPTFYLDATPGPDFNTADLVNQLLLAIGGNITADLLNATITTPWGDSLKLGLPQLLNQSFHLFTTPPVFNKEFALAGFNSIVGNSFTVSANPVPEPNTLLLLVFCILALLAVERRRRVT